VLEDVRFNRLLDRVRLCIAPSLHPRGLANVAWALASLHIRDTPMQSLIAEASLARVAEFQAVHLASTAWAFARFDYNEEHLW